MTDGIGITTYQYDDLYRRISVTDPFAATVGYDYNNVGNRTELSYPDNKVVVYTYNDDNQMHLVFDWEGGITTYDYDAAGRLTSSTLPNGVQSVNGYDDANRLLNLSHTSAEGTLLAEFDYVLDKVGNRITAVERLHSVGEIGALPTVDTFLESGGLLVMEVENGSAEAGPSHTWQEQSTQPDAGADQYLRAMPDVGQLYDVAQLSHSPEVTFQAQIGTPGSYTVWARGMAPNAAGDSLHIGLNGSANPSPLTGFLPHEWSWSKLEMNGSDATLELNSGTQTLNVWLREDGLRLDRLLLATDETYIPAGIGPAESELQAADALSEHTVIYGYDPLYRLTDATYSGDITADFEYVYDAVGNMMDFTETVGTAVLTDSRTFNDANQLMTSVEFPELGTLFEYFYDGNGNLTSIANEGSVPYQSYTYNQRNLLTEARENFSFDSAVRVRYLYDGNGNRAQQVDEQLDLNGVIPGSDITTTFTNDNAGLSQALVMDNGSTQTSNLFGLGLIFQDDGTHSTTLLVDGLGSVRSQMQGDSIEHIATYEPFGKTLSSTGSDGSTYGYTGEQTDGFGLTYLRARYYNPNLKLFLSRDPYPGQMWRPSSLHDYSYVENNPVNFIDPSGRYKDNVHHDLTKDIALEVTSSKWMAKEIAWANQRMDSLGLLADGIPGSKRTLMHFAQLPTILDNLRRAVALGNPTFFGAALHQYQDYFSHVGEGYTFEHAIAQLRADCRRGNLGACTVLPGSRDSYLVGQAMVGVFYGDTLLGINLNSDITVGSRNTVESRLSYLGESSEIALLSDGELIDVWLREQTEPRSAEREHYGYHTDFYYDFTRRDKAMRRGTRQWIERFFYGQVNTYPDEYAPCSISPFLPTPWLYKRPSNKEIREFILP